MNTATILIIVGSIFLYCGHLLMTKPSRGDDWITSVFGMFLFLIGVGCLLISFIGFITIFFGRID